MADARKETLVASVVNKGCDLKLGMNYELKANLIWLNMKEFDIILGMDCLAKSFVHVDCINKVINFHPLIGDGFSFHGSDQNRAS